MHDHTALIQLADLDSPGDELGPGHRSEPDLHPVDDLQLITIVDAAERLGLSRSKVYLLIADGELPTVHIGRARRIDLADLRAFVDRHRAA